MFEELQDFLHDVEVNVDEVLRNASGFSGDALGVDDAIREVLSNKLVEAGKLAIEKIPEFSYEPLKELFLNNLRRPEHIVITENNIDIFDENVGGNYDDLVAGQIAGGGHTETPQAPIVWKYGIYMPYAEGGVGLSSRLNLPTYEEIIDKRIAYWESQGTAPIWYFVENGNAGSSRAYPNFSGTGFITEFRATAQSILERARKLFTDRVYFDLQEALDLGIFINPKSRTRVTIYRYRIGTTRVAIQKTSAGNIFYRIGQKYYSVDEFKNLIEFLL